MCTCSLKLPTPSWCCCLEVIRISSRRFRTGCHLVQQRYTATPHRHTHTHRQTQTDRQTDRHTTVDSSEDRKRMDSFYVVYVYHYVEHPPQGTSLNTGHDGNPDVSVWSCLLPDNTCRDANSVIYVAVCGLAFDLTIPVIWRQPSYLALCANMTDITILLLLPSSFTCQLISFIITTLIVHHSFALSLHAQNLPFQ